MIVGVYEQVPGSTIAVYLNRRQQHQWQSSLLTIRVCRASRLDDDSEWCLQTAQDCVVY